MLDLFMFRAVPLRSSLQRDIRSRSILISIILQCVRMRLQSILAITPCWSLILPYPLQSNLDAFAWEWNSPTT